MPITSWRCPVCGNQSAPLDHFAVTDCGLKVHPSFAASVLRHDREHYGRGLVEVEVSDCLGCPRALGLAGTDWACDPTKHKAAESGTAWHAAMEKAVTHSFCNRGCRFDDNGRVEHRHVAQGVMVETVVRGTIEGVKVIGRVDCLVPSRKLIRDWKGKDDAEKAKKYGHDDYIAQLSLYAELTEQTLGWRPERAILDFHDHKSLAPVEVPLWDLATVLDYHPKRGDKTVRDLMFGAAMIRRGEAKWSDMPMSGESMQMGGGTLCNWCDHRSACRGF